MKKTICAIFVILAVASVCMFGFGCTEKSQEQTINVAVPDGAPALAIAKMLAGHSFDGYKVNYEIVAGTDIATKLTSNQVDIAIIPTNLAAKLYNNGIKIKTVASNVYGLLYLVGTEEITSISALKGEKIRCTGFGGTPDFVLQFVLNQYGLSASDVTIEYISQGSDAIAALKGGTAKFAVLGEPAATMSVNRAGAKVLADFQSEWEKSTGSYGYPQACTVVTDTVISEKSAFLKLFLKEMNNNVTWVQENVDSVNSAIAAYNGKTQFATAAVVSRCNVKYVGALESKSEVVEYLEIMSTFSSQFIGGKLPDDGFYAGVSLD
ncbi:MAG: ABC transporter substrate-binding protein [Christensenellales bacterium]